MDLWGEFEKSGYRFEAYLPSSSEEPHKWYLKVMKGDEVVREEHMPLMYPCEFGPDVADVNTLDEKVDEILGGIK